MIRGRNRITLLSLLASSLLLLSCNSSVVFTASSPLPGNKWEVMNSLVFDVPVTDTLVSNDVMFTIRTGSAYPFRNIFLFVKTTSPDGREISDTLEYSLADDKGIRYGRGFGDIRELKLPYKSNVFFPSKGTYRFTVMHGMRKEELNGIYDLGLKIQKISKQNRHGGKE